jgi:hypothetical protein
MALSWTKPLKITTSLAVGQLFGQIGASFCPAVAKTA